MTNLCAVCFNRPRRWAYAGVPLTMECFTCSLFNGRKYNRLRRKELDAKTLPTCQGQGEIVQPGGFMEADLTAKD